MTALLARTRFPVFAARCWYCPTASMLGLLATLMTAPAAAQTFQVGFQVDLATGGSPASVAFGDLNGDGLPDLVTANGANTVSVLLGNGAGQFLRTDYGTGADPTSVAIGDVNGDGKPDLVTSNYDDNSVSVLLGNGSGGFGTKTDFATGVTPNMVAIADVSGDGRLDLATPSYVAGTVSVLLGNGAGGFGAKTDFGTASSPLSAAFGDVSGDGRLDLVVANGNANTVSVLLGNGAGGFGAKTDFATGLHPVCVAISDVNGDGRPDLAVANDGNGANSVSVLLGNGTGGFGAKTDYATGVHPQSVAIADMTGDGLPDLVTPNDGSNSVSVLPGNGAGGFGAASQFAIGQTPFFLAVADLNGDGRRDVVTANLIADTVTLLFGNGTGGFGTRSHFAAGNTPWSVAIGDVSGDGRLDLVTANITIGSPNGTVSVLLNDGAGGFGPKTDYATGKEPVAVAIGDVNGNFLDLVTANSGVGENKVSVLLGTGGGVFGPKTDYTTGTAPQSVVIRDVSGDGKPDLVTANYTANTVSVLLGNGTGGFGPKTDFATGTRPTSVVIGHLNGDSWPDLITANSTASSVSVLLGVGGGAFGAKTDFASGNSPWSAAIGDLNGDALPDLAVTNLNGGSVSVHLGNGTGGFGAKTDFMTGGEPSAVAIGDLNVDGRLDLVVTNWALGNHSVVVMLGNGKGGFGPKTDLASARPRSVAIGDLNADGRLDLALADLETDSVSVLPGLEPTRTTVAVAPNPVALGAQVTLTATVTILLPASGTLTDSVRFFDGTTPLGAAPVSGSVASLTVTATRLGDRAITAEYKGDGKRFGSISPVKTLRVGFAPPNCRFASAVVSFSSQYSPTDYAAIRALGPPDIYPAYGDAPNAWASATGDGSAEYLQLAFPNPAPINFVNVYETYAPGAITSISVKNPSTGLLEVVWTAIAAAAPAQSRLFTATFPETPFAVSEVRIDLDSPAVPDWNEIDAVAIGKVDRVAASQWASGVVSFSSEFGGGYAATSSLGSPNVFPAYGDLGGAWASLTADGQREFLDLGFATPSAINFVNVVETYAPGALDKVSVKNPNTGLFEVVWSGTAAPAPAVSRIFTVSFPEPRFLVSEVRLDFDSPVVPDWNEIDAVGIGRCACQPTLVDVPTPGAVPIANRIDLARPNPFSASTRIAFSLARAGRVRIEVFDVAGHRVAQLMDRTLPAGPHDARWHGRSASGRTVASGIYYLRIASPELSETRKVVKIE